LIALLISSHGSSRSVQPAASARQRIEPAPACNPAPLTRC
jgi:hypothetical protein